MAGSGPIEEQTLPRYHQKHYCPVKPGVIFNNRYQVIAKLGYGAHSTVWLARDEKSKEYTSLKVCIQDEAETSPIMNEISMLKRLAKIAAEAPPPEDEDFHTGIPLTRLARDIFEIQGPTGRHHCIAMKAEGNSLGDLQQRTTDARLPIYLLRPIIQQLLVALNWLHADCGVIHTDISPRNILMAVEDDVIFRNVEGEESKNPSVPVMTDGGPVYESVLTGLALSGTPVLTDFGKMRLAQPLNTDWWMPDIYRAPEVLLKLPWGYEVDLWSVGVMTMELVEGKNLFDPVDRVNHQYVLPLALAQYIGYMGLPPLNMIKKSPLLTKYFDPDGNWAYDYPIPQSTFENFVTAIPPGEDKDTFLRFIRRMLTWDPAARTGSSELVIDEWLMKTDSTY